MYKLKIIEGEILHILWFMIANPNRIYNYVIRLRQACCSISNHCAFYVSNCQSSMHYTYFITICKTCVTTHEFWQRTFISLETACLIRTNRVFDSWKSTKECSIVENKFKYRITHTTWIYWKFDPSCQCQCISKCFQKNFQKDSHVGPFRQFLM